MRSLTRALAMITVLVTPAVHAGVAVEGHDDARIVLPRGVDVETYHNVGYAVVRDGDEARVVVDVDRPRPAAPFEALRGRPDDPIDRLSRSLTIGARDRYEASSRLLAWVSRHIEYHLDRSLSQAAADVLARRSGYCTGVARLTVALHEAVGIPAREVPGFVATDRLDGDGFHRWIEVELARDRWVFSDPLTSHHFVPASYVRLASDRIAIRPGEALVLARHDALRPLDRVPGLPEAVNVAGRHRRHAATLTIDAIAYRGGTAILEGTGWRRSRSLDDGSTSFLGLEPGRYALSLRSPGRQPYHRAFDLPDRESFRIVVPSRRQSLSGTAWKEPVRSAP